MQLKLFDYNLPKSLIAQKPIKPRDYSRLFLYNKKTKKIMHKHFFDLPDLIEKNSVLVFNNTKVFPARLFGVKQTGGKIEVFLLKKINDKTWEVLLKSSRKKINDKIKFNKKLDCTIITKNQDETWLVKFNLSGIKFWQEINKNGQVPLPPYIKSKSNLREYQTIYAKTIGSVAAPTAGFHFNKKLLNNLKKKGIQIEFVTLHVGLGTFAPVKSQNITKHKIHSEWAELNKLTAERLNKAKKEKKKIIAVGTTSVRTLEAFTNNKGILVAQKKWVNLFIYPGYKFKFIDNIITNFHLPKSSLLMLVSAFLDNKNKTAGIKILQKLYKIAIRKKYRFYSFGDGMFIK